MLRNEADMAINILDRYYISSEFNIPFVISYNIKDKNIHVEIEFNSSFEDTIDKSKCSFIKKYRYYIFDDCISFLYFFHEYRNYIFAQAGLDRVECLDYMLNDIKVFQLKNFNLSISNGSWVIDNYDMYLKARNNEILNVLLPEFDKLVNPYYDGIKEDDVAKTSDIKTYLDWGKECIHFTIKDDSIKKYLRRRNGYVYTLINEKIICHYFNESGEGIVVSYNDNKVRYNMTKNILEVNDEIIEYNENIMYFIYESLMDVIKDNNIELYKKIKMFKKNK